MEAAEKRRSILIIVVSQVAVLSLWFVSSAILPEMRAEAEIGAFAGAALISAVGAGFVTGALVSASLGIADRFDPRRVLMLAAIGAALANLALLVTPVGGAAQITLRFLTGAFLAGVYPVGMKIAVGWGEKDRGYLVGLLVGALTVGSSSPHLLSWFGGADWRLTVGATSALAIMGGVSMLYCGLGPSHARAAALDVGALRLAWTNRRVRLAYAGYLGHMWELYAFWAWVSAAAALSYGASLGEGEAASLAKLTAFGAIALGGLMCAPAGLIADRVGKAEVAKWAMVCSGLAAVATALSFGGPVWLTLVLMLLWGAAVVPDSAQFSALVADAAPPDRAGSLMTLQTALGFGLTIGTVQVMPLVAAAIGWPLTLAGLAVGPALGVWAMRRLIALGPA